MDCEEFLKQFRESLEGKVSENVIQDNLNYYRSYIRSQAVNGRSEEAVLNMLGDPRLLAKTIEESSKFANQGRSRSGGTGSFENRGNDHEDEYKEPDRKHGFGISGWLMTCLALIFVFIVAVVAFKAFVFLAPFLLVFMGISFLVKTVVGRRDGK